MSALILEFWLFVWKEIRPAKEFTQTVRDNLVLALDDIAVVIEFVDGIRITIGSQLIGFKSSRRFSLCPKLAALMIIVEIVFSICLNMECKSILADTTE